jgi:tetratricopeptide (TPR) repeat protein
MKLFIFSREIKGIILLLFFSLNIFAQSTDNEIDQKFAIQFENARLVFHNAYFEKASILFDSLISQQNDLALSYGYAAMIDYLLFKDPSQNISKAKSLSSETDVNHLFTLALCSFANGELSNCESLMKEFLSIHPDNKYGMHVLGFTQTDLGRPEDGIKTLNELIDKHPLYSPAHNHIGYAYLKLEQNENALNAFTRFLEADTLNPSAMDSYAEGLAAMKEYDLAIAYLTKAVLLEPNFAYGWMHMGDILKQSGELELAIRAYSHAKENASLYGAYFIDAIDEKIVTSRK